jgi:predicted transglutaminase-like cysteine proteinase
MDGTMRAQLVGRKIAMPIAILLTLLTGSESGLASNDSANGRDPTMGSARVFTPARFAKTAGAGSQMTALNPVEEPFASSGLHFANGQLARIWQDVKLGVLIDMASLALCAAQEASCSPAARALRKIVDEARSHDGLARIGFINRAINLAIKPAVDPFIWQSALATLSAGAGDCKDYGVAKYFALLEAGLPERDVKLVIVRDMAAHQDHAIVAVRFNGGWIVLDNRWLALVHNFELRRAEPLYILDEDGVRRFGQRKALPSVGLDRVQRRNDSNEQAND